MEGNVRIRKTNTGEKRWQARYARKHPGKPGQRLVTSATFATKTDAKNWLAEQHVKYNRDPHHNPERAKTPFPALVEQWQQVRAASWTPKSRARYEQVCRTHLLPEFGGGTVGDVSREWVRDYLAGMAAIEREDGTRRYADGTVHKVHTTLSAIMSEAVERGMVSANPCRGITRNVIKPERRKMVVLTPAEVHALADAMGAKHPPYRTLVLTAAFTGLRAGELHALRRRDLNLIAGELVVVRAVKTWRNGVPVFGMTKTEKPRTVALCPELCELLAAHLPADGHPDDLVFTSMLGGGAIHQVAFLRNHFKPARLAALPNHTGLRFHDLRHTFVSLLIQQGVNVKAIAAQAGHASAAMTLDVYAHLFPGDEAPVKLALSAAWAAAKPNVVPLRKEAA